MLSTQNRTWTRRKSEPGPSRLLVGRIGSIQMLNPLAVPRAVLHSTADVLLDATTEVVHLGIKKKRPWEIANIESKVGIYDAEASVCIKSVVRSLITGHVHLSTASDQCIRYPELRPLSVKHKVRKDAWYQKTRSPLK